MRIDMGFSWRISSSEICPRCSLPPNAEDDEVPYKWEFMLLLEDCQGDTLPVIIADDDADELLQLPAEKSHPSPDPSATAVTNLLCIVSMKTPTSCNKSETNCFYFGDPSKRASPPPHPSPSANVANTTQQARKLRIPCVFPTRFVLTMTRRVVLTRDVGGGMTRVVPRVVEGKLCGRGGRLE